MFKNIIFKFRIKFYTFLFSDMDNLEYFNGAVPPSILADYNKNDDKNALNEENNTKEGKALTEDKERINDKRLPMPPINTNFKGITAAALVASRRKVNCFEKTGF